MSDEFFTVSVIKNIILKTPMILTEPINEIKVKYDYVQDVMGIPREAMGKSNFLFYDFSHIYCRHQFLFRAGKYQRQDPRKYDKRIDVNPSLRSIMDTSDRDFAEKVAGLTREEYSTFVQMCDIEMEHGEGIDSIDVEDDSDDSDDDDDDDDDEEEEEEHRDSYRKSR
jgi:mTERF domain-containing protein